MMTPIKIEDIQYFTAIDPAKAAPIDYKPVPRASEDFETIARRLKEIEAEKQAAREKQRLE